MYPPSIISQQQETKLTLASAIKEIYWLMPLGGSRMAAFRSQTDFIMNLSSPCLGFASLPLDFMLRQAELLAAASTDSKPRGKSLSSPTQPARA